MPSKALQLRIQQAERDLRVLQEQSRQLEAKLDALKTSVEREESERSTLPTADTVSKAPASPPPLPPPPSQTGRAIEGVSYMVKRNMHLLPTTPEK